MNEAQNLEKKMLKMGNYNTIVQCKKCGRTQYLQFVNGLKHGWSKCHGEIMPIIYCNANIENIVKEFCTKEIEQTIESILR